MAICCVFLPLYQYLGLSFLCFLMYGSLVNSNHFLCFEGLVGNIIVCMFGDILRGDCNIAVDQFHQY